MRVSEGTESDKVGNGGNVEKSTLVESMVAEKKQEIEVHIPWQICRTLQSIISTVSIIHNDERDYNSVP